MLNSKNLEHMEETEASFDFQSLVVLSVWIGPACCDICERQAAVQKLVEQIYEIENK